MSNTKNIYDTAISSQKDLMENFNPIGYEDSIFHDMASDIKQPMQEQITIMQKKLDLAVNEALKTDQRAIDAEKEADASKILASRANWIAVGSFVLSAVLTIVLHILGQ